MLGMPPRIACIANPEANLTNCHDRPPSRRHSSRTEANGIVLSAVRMVMPLRLSGPERISNTAAADCDKRNKLGDPTDLVVEEPQHARMTLPPDALMNFAMALVLCAV